ncbi:MAG: monofunctional biosynthetic peptidoglycan transglycosylase [Bacteroidota bacterium]
MNKKVKKYLGYLGKGIIAFFVSTILMVIIYRFVPVPYTLLMFQRGFERMADGKSFQIKKDWVSKDKINPKLDLAVFCAEDQNFLIHEGFDMKAIEAAMEYNEKHANSKHPKTRGASTISQQCAKNVFLWPNRGWIRKGLEVYFTFLIEKIWSKERIMEVYLNVIEFGDGVYGAEAAAKTYFNCSASNLTAPQCALMAIVLPNPRKFNIAKPTSYMHKRQNWVMRQMGYQGGELDYDKEAELKEKETKAQIQPTTTKNKKKKTKHI